MGQRGSKAVLHIAGLTCRVSTNKLYKPEFRFNKIFATNLLGDSKSEDQRCTKESSGKRNVLIFTRTDTKCHLFLIRKGTKPKHVMVKTVFSVDVVTGRNRLKGIKFL